LRPNLIQCSTFCFWKVSSTNVVNGAGPSGSGRSCARWTALPVMADLLRDGWKLAREQLAQHVTATVIAAPERPRP
jgi:hypothetical protein